MPGILCALSHLILIATKYLIQFYLPEIITGGQKEGLTIVLLVSFKSTTLLLTTLALPLYPGWRGDKKDTLTIKYILNFEAKLSSEGKRRENLMC